MSIANDSCCPYTYQLINPVLNSIFARNGTNNIPISSKLRELRNNLLNSNYTFIVPNTKVLEWSVDKDSLLPFRDLFLQDDCLLSHIIQVVQSESQLSRNNNQRARYYSTVNNKTIIIKDGYIHTHKGFNKYVRSKIVREYIFYPSCDFLNNNSQFLVYEVEVPLVGVPIRSIEVSPTVSSKYELAMPKGLGLKKDKGVNKELSKELKRLEGANGKPKDADGHTELNGNGSKPYTLRAISNESISSQPTTPSPLDIERILSSNSLLTKQILAPLLTLIEEFDCSSSSSEDELLSMFDSIIEESLQIFKSLDSSLLQQMIKDNLTYDNLSNSIYRFIETNVSDQLWNKLIEIRQEADTNLTSLINTMKYIDISQIGLPEEFTIKQLFYLDKKVWKASKELTKLSEFYSAEEKIDVILSVIHILSNNDESDYDLISEEDYNDHEKETEKSDERKPSTSSSKSYSPNINADVFVSLLLVVVCRSDLENLDSHLFYARNFTYKNSETGQLGYGLLTLEGVLFHIVNESKNISPLSTENFKLWQFIKDNNTNPTQSSPSIYLNTLSKEQPSWKSIIRSRSPSAESSLMLSIQHKNLDAFKSLVELTTENDTTKLFSNTYLLNDSSDNGTTLLIAAVHTEDEQIIKTVLKLFLSLAPSILKKYLSLTDNWKRSVGHYFFHAPWLINKIGHLISWEQRDQNGQTPLFALCRSYDHNDYNSLITTGFQSWNQNISALRPDEKPNILDHIDNKGNTLLHIVKDRHAVEQLFKYNVDVNWPNEKGLTPLMVYSKYSRLSAILSLSQHPLIDLERTDFRALNALDLAKEIQTLTLLDGECCASGGWAPPRPVCSASRRLWTNWCRNIDVLERAYGRESDIDHPSIVCQRRTALCHQIWPASELSLGDDRSSHSCRLYLPPQMAVV